MMKLRSVTAGLMATAMLATSATPAMAQGYPGGYGGGYRGSGYGGYGGGYRHRDHDNTGAVVAGVIGVGILAAIIASASSSNNRSRSGGYDNRYGNIRSDSQAADACAVAAEQRLGNGARTRSIDSVDRVSDGYNVRGVVGYATDNGRYDDRYGSRDTRSFSCSVRYGDVQRVDFGGYAYNGY